MVITENLSRVKIKDFCFVFLIAILNIFKNTSLLYFIYRKNNNYSSNLQLAFNCEGISKVVPQEGGSNNNVAICRSVSAGVWLCMLINPDYLLVL